MWRYLLAGVVLAGWAALGDPPKDIANLVWPNTPAPWETVDGVFYPDRYDLTRYEEKTGLADLDECRDWTEGRALEHGDRGIRAGGYECGFGFIGEWGEGKVCRNTTR